MARGRDNAARWCALAERRLDHLTEMFETGRWRRYHSELAFLENIQEAKRAVQTWRALAAGEEAPVTSALGAVALGWTPAAALRDGAGQEHVQTVQPKAVQIDAETAVPVELDAIPDGLAETSIAPLAEPAAAPERVIEFTLSLDGIEARYPLLRNAF
nr:TIGR03809 family protein [Bradyrhizobium sp.]